jgi:hypothetical protein
VGVCIYIVINNDMNLKNWVHPPAATGKTQNQRSQIANRFVGESTQCVLFVYFFKHRAGTTRLGLALGKSCCAITI